MGVRIDARPFIWWSDQTEEYSGFFWDICTKAVERANYSVAAKVEVDAAKRAAFLNTGSGGYDLLCDPTTITLARMRNFTRAGGSIPSRVFAHRVRGERFIRAAGARRNQAGGAGKGDRGCNADHVRQSDQKSGLMTSLKEGVMTSLEDGGRWIVFRKPEPDPDMVPRYTDFEVWGYVVGATIGKTVRISAQTLTQSSQTTLICVEEQESHEEAAKKFCTGKLSRYFGDVDIVRAAIDEYLKEPGTCARWITRQRRRDPTSHTPSSSRRERAGVPRTVRLGTLRDVRRRQWSAYLPGTSGRENRDAWERCSGSTASRQASKWRSLMERLTVHQRGQDEPGRSNARQRGCRAPVYQVRRTRRAALTRADESP